MIIWLALSKNDHPSSHWPTWTLTYCTHTLYALTTIKLLYITHCFCAMRILYMPQVTLLALHVISSLQLDLLDDLSLWSMSGLQNSSPDFLTDNLGPDSWDPPTVSIFDENTLNDVNGDINPNNDLLYDESLLLADCSSAMHGSLNKRLEDKPSVCSPNDPANIPKPLLRPLWRTMDDPLVPLKENPEICPALDVFHNLANPLAFCDSGNEEDRVKNIRYDDYDLRKATPCESHLLLAFRFICDLNLSRGRTPKHPLIWLTFAFSRYCFGLFQSAYDLVLSTGVCKWGHLRRRSKSGR